MTPEEYIELYEKNAAGKCSAEEKRALESYQDQFSLVDQPWTSAMGEKSDVRMQILSRLHEQVKPAHQSFLSRRSLAIAAVGLMIATGGILFFSGERDMNEVSAQPKVLAIVDEVLPGKNRATLILDGKPAISLDEVKNGLLVQQGNISIAKLADGHLVYSSTASEKSALKPVFNKVMTPRGGQYQLVLADGTKVWLNAASSIRFPVAFIGKSRIVQLEGEAYFEVAKNGKMPFIVELKKMNVDVLGTHFNVSAYDDEEEVRTTLLEGSVRLTTAAKKAMLKPGEQAVYAKNQSLKVTKANVEDAIAWKNGYFVFDNENIHSIMRKVSRWYDVSVVYKGNIDQKEFGGTVSRFTSVSSVLKSLELTGTVHFKKEGRRITVMP
ncbi:ferric-dicitrate binding protein FerR (iron transport regulator) [Pedobacter sp. CAN_A7]|uniref:FecR family protein n=1 Tax=Pedobacter sp. CAN_A7 TaxID=2787722 RepID=UPI0018CAB246